MICHACGSANVAGVSRPLPQQLGRHRIVNQFGHVLICHDCSEWTIAGAELSRLELQAVVITFQAAPADQLAGAELRAARKALGLTRTELAISLGHDIAHLTRWENQDEALPMWLKPAMVGLAKTQLDPEPAGPTLDLSA